MQSSGRVGRVRKPAAARFRDPAILTLALGLTAVFAVARSSGEAPRPGSGPASHGPDARDVRQGREIFRYDTFGDEAFWGGTLRLHEAVATLSPVQALGLGLKVDTEALPPRLRTRLRQGRVDLEDPATTLDLLRLDAVVGVAGFFSPDGRDLRSIGIRCALCHSTVDDSFAPGVGRRLDGWANRDLNVGAIIAAAPDLSSFATVLGADQATVRKVLGTWGPGKFDPFLVLDGKAFRPDGGSASVLIPPAFGLAGVGLATTTGWGSISYWNNFVAVLEMHAQGSFKDPRLNDPVRFPLAAANGFFDVEHIPDRVTPKLPALRAYQLSLGAPKAPARSFHPVQALRGGLLFQGKAACASCHTPPAFAARDGRLYAPEEIGIDSFQADRSPTGRYRAAPLRGLWSHAQGGFYHDGRFQTLEAVVDHYNSFFNLGLTDWESADLVEYLKSF